MIILLILYQCVAINKIIINAYCFTDGNPFNDTRTKPDDSVVSVFFKLNYPSNHR